MLKQRNPTTSKVCVGNDVVLKFIRVSSKCLIFSQFEMFFFPIFFRHSLGILRCWSARVALPFSACCGPAPRRRVFFSASETHLVFETTSYNQTILPWPPVSVVYYGKKLGFETKSGYVWRCLVCLTIMKLIKWFVIKTWPSPICVPLVPNHFIWPPQTFLRISKQKTCEVAIDHPILLVMASVMHIPIALLLFLLTETLMLQEAESKINEKDSRIQMKLRSL